MGSEERLGSLSFLKKFFFFFLMLTICKVLIVFVTVLLLCFFFFFFMFCFGFLTGCKACGIWGLPGGCTW